MLSQNEAIYILSHAVLCVQSNFLRAMFPVAFCQDQLCLFFIRLFIIMLLYTWLILPPLRRPGWLKHRNGTMSRWNVCVQRMPILNLQLWYYSYAFNLSKNNQLSIIVQSDIKLFTSICSVPEQRSVLVSLCTTLYWPILLIISGKGIMIHPNCPRLELMCILHFSIIPYIQSLNQSSRQFSNPLFLSVSHDHYLGLCPHCLQNNCGSLLIVSMIQGQPFPIHSLLV